eukprot:3206637-Amphidinium_carterae.1
MIIVIVIIFIFTHLHLHLVVNVEAINQTTLIHLGCTTKPDPGPGSMFRCTQHQYYRMLALVMRDGRNLRKVPSKYRGKRAIVKAAVRDYGCALQYATRKCKANQEIVLLAVSRDYEAMRFADDVLKSDRGFAIEAVAAHGNALKHVDAVCKSDREVVHMAVRREGAAIRFACDECKTDHEIALTAVQQDAFALEYVGEVCKANRDIVLAAVKLDGNSLEYATDQCKADREIVDMALQESIYALAYAHESLLLDPTFAPEVKEHWFILKIRLMSGRYTILLAHVDDSMAASSYRSVMQAACERLQLVYGGNEILLHNNEEVPPTSVLAKWPGIVMEGQVAEYLLLIRAP